MLSKYIGIFCLFSCCIGVWGQGERFLTQAEWNPGTELGEFLSLPFPDGREEMFSIQEQSVFTDSLQNRFQTIRSYVGRSVKHPSVIARIDQGPLGFHGMILWPGKKTVFIEPLTYSVQIVHKVSTARSLSLRSCTLEAEAIDPWQPAASLPSTQIHQSDCQLRTYRLALATTGEFTAYFGGTAQTMAALSIMVNRINGIYERDLAIRFQLVTSNDTLIFTDSLNDPYSPDMPWQLLSQNQQAMDSLLGPANYDLGQVLWISPEEVGPTGQASLQSACNPDSKAKAATASAQPDLDAFAVGLLAHELGHQFGALHTQNNECQFTAPAAVEVGSGSTIMSYAGFCEPNVQPTADDYFHGISLREIHRFLSDTNHTCPQLSPLMNQAPELEIDKTFYQIPKLTPFVLSANGEDPDGDSLTYSWEQINPEMAPMPPMAQVDSGPAFRSYPPVYSANRYIPQLVDLAGDSVSEWEVLADGSRHYRFQLSLRDQAIGGGCVAYDTVRVEVTDTAGPFLVTEPNSDSIIWEPGSTQSISWEVAGTDTGLIQCQAVDILLSLDDGRSFSDTLLLGSPNTGSALLTLPMIVSDQVRFMVKCSDNLFFDISDQPISIQGISSIDHNDRPMHTQVSPNPSTGELLLSYPFQPGESLQLRISTLGGTSIFQQEFLGDSGGKICFSIPKKWQGLFLLHISSPTINETHKLILLP